MDLGDDVVSTTTVMQREGKMKDTLKLSRLAYPRATLITFLSLLLLVLSVGIFADPYIPTETAQTASAGYNVLDHLLATVS